MLKETYVANLKNIPQSSIKVAVGYPSLFSPSERLLKEFNEIKNALIQGGLAELAARKKAWEQTDFEKRYRAEIRSNPLVMNKLRDLKKLAEKQDVYLYCYCGKTPCHRFILMDMIQHLNE
ncbi:MAG: DUF488 family protein [Candidatus Thermoplasmatota archaeon]|nr:DUF488 family protein [Candidatus Thermoplasmatota archaeon]